MPLMKKKQMQDAKTSSDSIKSLPIALGIRMRSKKGKMAGKAPEMEDPSSVAEAIMKKRKMADGGMVDLDSNSEEMSNEYDELNMDAAGKEQYDDDQLSPQPMDSNEHGHSIEDELDKGIVAAIRRKMAAKRGE